MMLVKDHSEAYYIFCFGKGQFIMTLHFSCQHPLPNKTLPRISKLCNLTLDMHSYCRLSEVEGCQFSYPVYQMKQEPSSSTLNHLQSQLLPVRCIKFILKTNISFLNKMLHSRHFHWWSHKDYTMHYTVSPGKFETVKTPGKFETVKKNYVSHSWT